ncbi:MAG: GGDEF domain-containing protein [bacterium]|nr:GGDEF domain-containing protein [bacterium]
MGTAAVSTESLSQRILAADNLPTLPAVALKVVGLTQSPDVSINEIARVIQNDPALSGRILKVANSSLFGFSKKIASIHHATVVLGLRAVKVMALSFSLVDCFGGRKAGEFDFEKYWRRSLSMAVGAKLLAEAARDARRDEAFVGGLLADLGLMAGYLCAPQEYAPVLEAYARGEGTLQELEASILGTTHACLSAKLLSQWNLPELVCDAVAAHHGKNIENLDERSRIQGSILWAAAQIADLFCGDLDSADLEGVVERCNELTGIAPTRIEAIMADLDQKVTETAALLTVDIGPTTSYEAIRLQAMSRLAGMSLDAELGRSEATRRAETAQHELDELSDQTAELRQQAITDPLTGIGNRQAFDRALDDGLEEARESDGMLGLILIDLDRFKRINDTYGHMGGDDVLQAVADALRRACKGSSFAARYGGEEFAVVAPAASTRYVRQLAERIRGVIERLSVEYHGQDIRLTASLGVAHVNFANERAVARQLIERADACLYDAKRKGRNRVEMTF